MKTKKNRGYFDRITCADRTTISVQAGTLYSRAGETLDGFLYSRPREGHGPFTHVEILVKSSTNSKHHAYLKQYSENFGSVYAYVPAHPVPRLIADHGGMVSGELPPLAFETEESEES